MTNKERQDLIGGLWVKLGAHPNFAGGYTERHKELAISDAALGAAFRSYFMESCHGNWDGFERHQMTGINAMLADFALSLPYEVENLDQKGVVFPFDPSTYQPPALTEDVLKPKGGSGAGW